TSYDHDETCGLYCALLKKGGARRLLRESDEERGVGSAPSFGGGAGGGPGSRGGAPGAAPAGADCGAGGAAGPPQAPRRPRPAVDRDAAHVSGAKRGVQTDLQRGMAQSARLSLCAESSWRRLAEDEGDVRPVAAVRESSR